MKIDEWKSKLYTTCIFSLSPPFFLLHLRRRSRLLLLFLLVSSLRLSFFFTAFFSICRFYSINLLFFVCKLRMNLYKWESGEKRYSYRKLHLFSILKQCTARHRIKQYWISGVFCIRIYNMLVYPNHYAATFSYIRFSNRQIERSAAQWMCHYCSLCVFYRFFVCKCKLGLKKKANNLLHKYTHIRMYTNIHRLKILSQFQRLYLVTKPILIPFQYSLNNKPKKLGTMRFAWMFETNVWIKYLRFISIYVDDCLKIVYLYIGNMQFHKSNENVFIFFHWIINRLEFVPKPQIHYIQKMMRKSFNTTVNRNIFPHYSLIPTKSVSDEFQNI